MPEAKPYCISKKLVMRAWQLVNANRGAAGVDGESMSMFEKDLKGNLYRIWNRMSSGSWKAKYGGMDVSEAQEAKQLRDENTRLKKLVVELSLDKEMQKAVIAKKGRSS